MSPSFKELLTHEHSRQTTDEILRQIQSEPKRIEELMECFLSDDLRLCQRAAWPVGDLGEKFPELIIPYFPQLIANLKQAKHDAVIRNTVRTWQNMHLPKAYQGEIFGLCFDYMINPKIPIAIRAFSMTVCANICIDEPELKNELILAIEDIQENASPGICTRSRSILTKLKK